MFVLNLLSISLAFLAASLACDWYLFRRQKITQRREARRRFGVVPTKRADWLNTAKLPLIGRYIRKTQAKRLEHLCEAELPRMLDILAMGMHAGLSFDAAFGLYVHRFDSELARICLERYEIWQRGLISRSEGLQQLAARVNVPIFDRFCRTASRSIRYGIPMAPLIREYAEQARKEYRNKQKELVLKAPVKMLLPTGTLILPAMMMLVIGPILLDVTGRMV